MMFSLVVSLLFSFIVVAFGEDCTTEHSVRLVGGSGDWEGNVQYCYNGQWGAVCHSLWDNTDAAVVCKELGFGASAVQYRTSAYYGTGYNYKNVLDQLGCAGTESRLRDCPKGVDLGKATCGKTALAGVFCGGSGKSCTQGDIRLGNNYPSSYGRSEGRVEICTSGTWGVICAYPSYTWSTLDTRVACKQFGMTSTTVNSYYYGGGRFGYSTLPFKYASVGCNGAESSLLNCPSTATSSCSGSHYYDAGVRCYSDAGSCTNGEIRLYSAFDNTPSNEGIVQLCKGGQWSSICHHFSTCYLAKTACVQLGYTGALGVRYNAGYYYGYTEVNDRNRYYCYSSLYTSLSQCFSFAVYYCGAYNDALGVICYGGSDGGECTNGDVRLVNGSTTNEGRVEYCASGAWSPVCSLSSYTANLMCKKLGYTDFTWGLAINDERFGRSELETPFNYLYCSSTAAKLSDCTERTKGYGCYITSSACYREYSLRCYNPGECKDGDVRLVDGKIQQEGRPEVCVNGVWSSFCQWSWSGTDAFVFCGMLGYDGPNPTIYYNSYFGSGYGPVAYSNVYCQGWENDIHECTKSVYPSFTCYSSYIAGAVCKEGCVDGQVRLYGGGFGNEGTVEVCFSNLWGLISDVGWNDADARVVCKQLGHVDGIFTPKVDSYYGKPNKTIHLKDVSCIGDEEDISQCTQTQVSLTAGKNLLSETEVAGVDCLFDEPTPPPCITNPSIDPSDACTGQGDFRLMNNGLQSTSEGRVEYCYGGYWTPVCNMDARVAAVACRNFGYNTYYWGAVIDTGEYGTLLNYSLVQNITCSGSEGSVGDCIAYPPIDSCLPWCPMANLGLKCFNTGKCTSGDVRLVDGVLDQEGRVEVCVNEVWGSICDDGWDETDAHVACTKLGLPEQKPVVIPGSYFGSGSYPIVYSNMGCGGWEQNFDGCTKTGYDDFTCDRSKVAGVLCGYDCSNGDVRLVGSDYNYEGVVEICFNNLWGLIEEVGWTVVDAQVVCKQLGYEIEGTVAMFTKDYKIPSKTVHSSNVQCTGDEDKINECTQTTFGLETGKTKRAMPSLKVAGVTCHTPDRCVPPPDNGVDCPDGNVRLSGDDARNGVGTLEYCYKGLWSGLCQLGEKEASVACRQLGFVDYASVSIFDDGRFESTVSNSSLFTNFSCGGDNAQLSLSDCTIFDACQSTCTYPISIACTAMTNCNEGDVRLKNGSVNQEGRVEVCHDNVWGSICGKGFAETDAYVVCKELNFGISQPTVFTNSKFGDGSLPIVYSNLGCLGYESSVLDCSREEYGSFSCSRDNVVGITCQDNCVDGSIRLYNSTGMYKGTLEICFLNLWGVISSADWDDTDTKVACRNLGYLDGTGYTNSEFGKPNITVHLSNMNCNGTESKLTECNFMTIAPDMGKEQIASVNVVGVSCFNSTTGQSSGQVAGGYSAGIVILAVMFVIALMVIISLVIYVVIIKKTRKSPIENLKPGAVTMSGLPSGDRDGVTNPAALYDDAHYDADSIMEKADLYAEN